MERKPIPVLRSSYGKEDAIIFAYPKKEEKITRTFRDADLYLEIEITEKGENIMAELYANFPDKKQKIKWKNHPMEMISQGRYKLDYTFNKCGLFEFKIRYTLDGGVNWLWDAGPVRKVLVDPPDMKSIKIYTLIPTVSGTITDWKEMLHKIKTLGFNGLHILPITKMGSSESPYSAVDLFTIDPSYVDPALPEDGITQFESFVEEAKQVGIKLFLDIVINHINPESNFASQCSDWIVADSEESDGFRRAGCEHKNSWIKWEDLVLINYGRTDPGSRYELWNYMHNYADFWTTYADYTGGGLRFDNLHSSDGDFVKFLTKKLKSDYPDLILIGEYFSHQEEFYQNVPKWQLNLILGNPWEYRHAPELRRYLKNIHTHGGLKYFLSLTTHDTESPTKEYGCVDSTKTRYMIYALMGTGQTGIVQGSETGIEEKIKFIGKNNKENSPVSGKTDLTGFFKSINNLLESDPVFQQIGNIHFVDNGHSTILAVVRSDAKGKSAWLLIANMDIHNSASIVFNQKNFKLPFRRFNLTNVLTGREISIADMVFDFTLEPCETKILRITE